MKYDVFGLENPLMDLLARVPDEFLERMELKKNHMMLVDQSRHRYLLDNLQGIHIQPEAGGSCANTILGIAQLGGKAAFCGKVGRDPYGPVYVNKLKEGGVTSFVSTDGDVTGSTVILVTPDAARTMNTYLGACQELQAKDVPLDAIKSSRMLYLTGYLWDTDGQKEAAQKALHTAGAEGVHVAMSLADPFCVHRHKKDFQEILKRYVDFVFANREEALALTETDNTHEAMKVLREWCAGAVITLGSSGAYVASGDEHIYLDARPVKAVDTTGAGDAFAAGFLYGRISGASMFQSGRLGIAFASQVIQQVGPRLNGDIRTVLADILNDPRP
ncbi:MAG: adenosine kinase [Deltaproteobacteria bacterium]|nr:adenosine kinase [Deltaproteobacteria bacterium]